MAVVAMVVLFGLVELLTVVAQIAFVHPHFPVMAQSLVSFISHSMTFALYIAAVFIAAGKLSL